MVINDVYRNRRGQFQDHPNLRKVNFLPTSFAHRGIFQLQNGRFHFHRDISRKEVHRIQNPLISLHRAAFKVQYHLYERRNPNNLMFYIICAIEYAGTLCQGFLSWRFLISVTKSYGKIFTSVPYIFQAGFRAVFAFTPSKSINLLIKLSCPQWSSL